jgi:4-hydroxy-3-methylbut-2-enyl diphosphate reductase
MRRFKLLLARPRGFCAGVNRAIGVVIAALEIVGPPVYVRREIVHNRHVLDALRERGAVFVAKLAVETFLAPRSTPEA